MQNVYKLVISEKPSVGKSIAAVLGANERKDGYFMGGGYIVSWCFGHLAELITPATALLSTSFGIVTTPHGSTL